MPFVSECSTYSLSLPCMRLDHDSAQVMKTACMRTTSSVSILNMGLKLELNLMKRLVFIRLFLFLICAEYVFVTFGATNDNFTFNGILYKTRLYRRLSKNRSFDK